jgi:serine/threonine-protein kinase
MLTPRPSGTILRQRYKLTNIVGSGGMGCVYRAEDVRLPGRLCAVKEIKPDIADSAETTSQAREQFLREASILAQLDHPNLPKVSDYFTEDEREYLVMDYVPGKDLKQLIDEAVRSNRLFEENTVLSWARQIVDALVYLHSQDPPVLHRDIKPSNIKLTPDDRIKLVDFGLVKTQAPNDRTLTVLQGRGTVLYTPLEQYGGDDTHTTMQSDLYAFGATLYHLLTLQAPPDAKARFLSPRTLKSPREVNPDVSQKISDAVLWAMAMHPDDRPDGVSDLREALFADGRMPAYVGERNSAESGLVDALRANQWLAYTSALLLVLAIILTLF